MLVVMVGNSYSWGDVFDLPFVGLGMRSLDREVSVSGCWVR